MGGEIVWFLLTQRILVFIAVIGYKELDEHAGSIYLHAGSMIMVFRDMLETYVQN